VKIPKFVGNILARVMNVATDDDEPRTYYFTADVTTRTVADCVKQLRKWAADSSAPIEIVLHSYGGAVDAGLWFVEEVRHLTRTHHVVTRVAGISASMAGVMLQAGTRRLIGHESSLHLHPPSTGVYGSIHEIGEVYDRIASQYTQLVNVYARRSHLTADDIRTEMDARADWYLTPDEALEYGFVDAVWGRP
jgi:ATP-dependent protease ClpP protease subunit